MRNFFDFAYASGWAKSKKLCIEMGKTLQNIMHRDGQNSTSIKIDIIFDKYLIRTRMKRLGDQICFTIIPDGIID